MPSFTPGATGYFDYFGSAAGSRTQGWHSSTFSGWRVIGLNSNCVSIGGCQTGSAQEKWLRSKLYTYRSKKCTIALWHHPRFSSGQHGDNPEMADLWNTLQDYDAEIVLSGHDHGYGQAGGGARSEDKLIAACEAVFCQGQPA